MSGNKFHVKSIVVHNKGSRTSRLGKLHKINCLVFRNSRVRQETGGWMLMSRKHEAISMIRGSIIKVSMALAGEFTQKLVVFEVCDSPNFRRTLRLVQTYFFFSHMYKIGVYYCCWELWNVDKCIHKNSKFNLAAP